MSYFNNAEIVVIKGAGHTMFGEKTKESLKTESKLDTIVIDSVFNEKSEYDSVKIQEDRLIIDSISSLKSRPLPVKKSIVSLETIFNPNSKETQKFKISISNSTLTEIIAKEGTKLVIFPKSFVYKNTISNNLIYKPRYLYRAAGKIPEYIFHKKHT